MNQQKLIQPWKSENKKAFIGLEKEILLGKGDSKTKTYFGNNLEWLMSIHKVLFPDNKISLSLEILKDVILSKYFQSSYSENIG